MKSIKFFGYSINLARKEKKTATETTTDKRRATSAIKKQAKREVSFQISDIKSALTAALNADKPDRGKLHDIFRYILRDGHLKSQIRLAKIKVLSEPWMIYTGDKPDEATTKIFTKRWMSKVIKYILESEFHGYSVIEATLGEVESGITDVVSIDREFISIEKQRILIDGNINGDFIEYADIMWDIDLIEFGDRNDMGSLVESAYNVIWKYYSRSDWSRTSEKYGSPILSIEAQTNDEKELDDIETRAANFGGDGYIVTQTGDKVNILERSGQRIHDIYLDNIILCNDENSKITVGQTSTSDEKSFVGSAEVHERVLDDITTERLQLVADEINERLVPYLIYKGLLKEGQSFNYPLLLRMREQRLAGKPLATDAKPEPGKEPEPGTEPAPKK